MNNNLLLYCGKTLYGYWSSAYKAPTTKENIESMNKLRARLYKKSKYKVNV